MVKLMDGIVSCPYALDFIWPDLSVFKTSQAVHNVARPNYCIVEGNGVLYVNDGKSIWVSAQDAGLQIHLQVIAHFWLFGHRGSLQYLNYNWNLSFYASVTHSEVLFSSNFPFLYSFKFNILVQDEIKLDI